MRIFICDKMVRVIHHNLDKMKSAVHNANEKDYEPYYIYSFALFESAICEAVKHILMAFPEKIKKIPQFIAEDFHELYPPRLYEILGDFVRSEMKTINKGDASKILLTAMDYCSITMAYDNKRLSDISEKRNVITHENIGSNSKNSLKSLQESKQDMTYLHGILEEFASNLEAKYGTYTLERLIKRFLG